MNDNPWAGRLRAVARARARYLYLLLILCVFFWALRGRHLFGDDSGVITLPIVNVEMSSLVPLALAPVVLGFLLLAVLGTFPALRVAHANLGDSENGFEAYDDVPTAIDFVVYSSSRSWRGRLGFLSYPAALTLAYAEAVWLWFEALEYEIVWHGIGQSLGMVLLLACLPRLASLWVEKARSMMTGGRPA